MGDTEMRHMYDAIDIFTTAIPFAKAPFLWVERQMIVLHLLMLCSPG